MRDDGSRWLIPDRHAHLDDSGLPGFVAAVAVEPDGEESLWLVRLDLLGEYVDHGNRYPRHELVGRLPGDVRSRIFDRRERCGAMTVSGRSCRNSRGGCRWHQEAES